MPVRPVGTRVFSAHRGSGFPMTLHCANGPGTSAETRKTSACALVLISAWFAGLPVALAQDSAPANGIPAKSIAVILPQNGDPDGSRKALAARGITYELNYVGEVQGNVSGGVSRGVTYIGRLEG